jgi:hypothetical protein
VKLFLSGTLVDLNKLKSTILGLVPGPVEPLVSRHADAVERRDGASGVGERVPLAKLGSKPGELGDTTSLRASREGEDAVEVSVSSDG